MRTNDPERGAAAAGMSGLREVAGRFRRRWGGLNAGVRLAASAGLVGLIVAGYLATPAETSGGVAWLFGGRPFTEDRLATVRGVLAASGIRAVTVEGDRVGVPAESLLPAQAAVRKAKLDPRSLDEILGELGEGGPFLEPGVRDQRADRVRGEVVAHVVERMPGIARAHVVFTPLRAVGPARERTAKALIDLETDGGRPPAARVVREVRDFVLGASAYAIRPEDVTVTAMGRPHLVSGDVPRLARLLLRAREEDLTDEVAAAPAIAGIPGATVAVRLEADPGRSWSATRPTVNAPAELEAGPEATPTAAAAARAAESARARVWVRVPRRHYRAIARPEGGAEPSAAELARARDEADARIEAAVRAAIPAGSLADVAVAEVADPPLRPAVATTPADAPAPADAGSRWPALAGAVAATGVGLILISRAFAARRPEIRPILRPHRPVTAADPEADEAGVADRVRALVRRDPEAAAGVLQRWIGQGGHDT